MGLGLTERPEGQRCERKATYYERYMSGGTQSLSYAEPPPMWEANDAIHFDITITFSERRCVFRFAHTGISSDL